MRCRSRAAGMEFVGFSLPSVRVERAAAIRKSEQRPECGTVGSRRPVGGAAGAGAPGNG